ncbi:MAG TPA: YceG family protein [Sporosarcina psychrophila]|uniref:YceG family protein n=1 Tax=Sporosarcina psychrophila TaxID=1476 RepID=A0A921FWE1_SPOPS|nr:YceG family protein [Sporosarcina psychrophila]
MIRKLILKKVEYSNWATELSKSITARPDYRVEKDSLQYSQIAARIVGAGFDETEYMIELFTVSQAPGVHVLSETLDKTMPPERFQSIQRIYDLIQEQPNLSINRFVAFLEGAQLLPKYVEDHDFNRLIRSALIEVFERFKENHAGSFHHPEFRRVFLDIIKWTWNHIDPWVKGTPIEKDVPHIIWYGDMNKSQMYFLFYVTLLGMDVVILHPEGKDEFKEIDPENKWSVLTAYPTTMPIQPFPQEEPKRQGTVAYRASKEIDHVLHHEGSAYYKPWQFRNHHPMSVTLKTTYDEIFILAKEKAFIRPNFSASGNEVKIPSLFAKISGVSTNRKDYWDKMHKLTSQPNCMIVKKFPFMQERKANNQYHYQHALGKDGRLNLEKMLKSNWWQYGYLHDGVQLGLAAAIARMCANPKMNAQPGESLEQVSLYLFTQAINLSEELPNLLQTFDYAQEIPKIVLYNNEINGVLSRADAALLLLLNEFGLDIILYNPPGHNDLEHFIEKDYFDHHLLEDMVFDLPYQEHKKDLSIVSGFLNRFFNGRD